MPKLLIYTDGACKGNGRRVAVVKGSYAVYEVPEDTRWYSNDNAHLELRNTTPLASCILYEISTRKGARRTNNFAEAAALQVAIIWLHDNFERYRPDSVEICMDSQVVYYQIQGIYKTHDAMLKQIYNEIGVTMAAVFDNKTLGDRIKFTWIPGDLMKQTILGH